MDNIGTNWDEHIDRILEVREMIPMKQLTILTGGNGKGKSLIRKVLWQHVAEKLGLDGTKNPLVSDCSMERRTGLHSNMGGGGVFLRDTEWTPTSINTYSFISGMLGASNRYLVIDEPEIGMSEESQLGLVNYLNKMKAEVLEKNYGMLVITHSRFIVANLDSDCFLNLEGMNKSEWLNRVIVAADLEELDKESTELFNAVNKRLKKK